MIPAVLLSAATPTPSTPPEVDADLVTPGLWGFVLLFFLALAVYLLGRSMARRVRRVNQRARVEAELDEAERSENGRAAGDGAADGSERLGAQTPAAADEDPPAPR